MYQQHPHHPLHHGTTEKIQHHTNPLTDIETKASR
jgi:hypothetical protein